jgi:transcriptional regulator with XRE-family HTH domain
MTVGEKIRMFRIAAGMTQKELADTAGVSIMAISQYERGIRHPKMSMVRKLASALRVKVYDMEEGESADPPNVVSALQTELAALREENGRLHAMFGHVSRMTPDQFVCWREAVDMARSMLSKE